MQGGSLTRRLVFLLYVVSATGAFAPAGGAPDVLGDINTVRTTICARGTPGAVLQEDPAVNAAAQRVAGGASSQEALLAVGYVAKRMASIHLEGYTDDAQIRQALAHGSCSLIADP